MFTVTILVNPYYTTKNQKGKYNLIEVWFWNIYKIENCISTYHVKRNIQLNTMAFASIVDDL